MTCVTCGTGSANPPGEHKNTSLMVVFYCCKWCFSFYVFVVDCSLSCHRLLFLPCVCKIFFDVCILRFPLRYAALFPMTSFQEWNIIQFLVLISGNYIFYWQPLYWDYFAVKTCFKTWTKHFTKSYNDISKRLVFRKQQLGKVVMPYPLDAK